MTVTNMCSNFGGFRCSRPKHITTYVRFESRSYFLIGKQSVPSVSMCPCTTHYPLMPECGIE